MRSLIDLCLLAQSHSMILNDAESWPNRLLRSVKSQIMLIGPPLEIRVRADKMYSFSNECENNLLVSDSAQTSFYTVKLTHSAGGTRRTTHF